MGKTIVTANHCLMDDPTTRRIAHHQNMSFRFQVTPVMEAIAGFVRV